MQTLDHEMEVSIPSKYTDEVTVLQALVEATEIEGEDRSVGIFGRVVIGFHVYIFDGVKNHEICKEAYENMTQEENDRICSVLTDLLQQRDLEGEEY